MTACVKRKPKPSAAMKSMPEDCQRLMRVDVDAVRKAVADCGYPDGTWVSVTAAGRVVGSGPGSVQAILAGREEEPRADLYAVRLP